jgi:hypothetical protein
MCGGGVDFRCVRVIIEPDPRSHSISPWWSLSTSCISGTTSRPASAAAVVPRLAQAGGAARAAALPGCSALALIAASAAAAAAAGATPLAPRRRHRQASIATQISGGSRGECCKIWPKPQQSRCGAVWRGAAGSVTNSQIAKASRGSSVTNAVGLSRLHLRTFARTHARTHVQANGTSEAIILQLLAAQQKPVAVVPTPTSTAGSQRPASGTATAAGLNAAALRLLPQPALQGMAKAEGIKVRCGVV